MPEKDIYDRDYEFVPAGDYLESDAESKKNNSLEKRVDQDKKATDNKKDRNFLKEILTDKISFLKELLDEIDVQIQDRQALKDTIIDKIDRGECYLRTKLYEIDTWDHGKNRNIDTRRLQIEKELEALKNQKRDEKRESWRDIARLKKEHRQFFHEYRNALKRVKVVFPDKFVKDKNSNTIKNDQN